MHNSLLDVKFCYLYADKDLIMSSIDRKGTVFSIARYDQCFHWKTEHATFRYNNQSANTTYTNLRTFNSIIKLIKFL